MIMGRRKKEINISYKEIVYSVYLSNKDYRAAQLTYSKDIGKIGSGHAPKATAATYVIEDDTLDSLEELE
jgi:hypothetical protein